MARDARQDALDRFAKYVELANLTERQALAVALRVGLGPTDEPLPITVIAAEFAKYFGAPVTRQYISLLIQRSKEKMQAAKLMDAFIADFPALAAEKISDLHMSSERMRALVRAAVRQKAAKGPIDYDDVLAAAGVPIPEHRQHQSGARTERQSMLALYADFGVRQFGDRAKICGICKDPKPLSEFYKTRTHEGSPSYSYMCRKCNTVRCREARWRKKAQQI